MDARERLRRYLEQRRELGESELVLDSMSVDDVLSLVGARAGAKPARSGRSSAQPDAGRTPDARAGNATSEDARVGHSDAENAHARMTPNTDAPQTPDAPDAGHPADTDRPPPPPPRFAPTASNDWRETLRAANPTAESRAADATSPVPPAVSTPVAAQLPAWLGAIGWSAGIAIGEPLVRNARASNEVAAALAALATQIAACTLCELHKSARNAVPGVGNPEAELMCVGEAPGATEDEHGVPFVGESGQLLTKILGAIDVSRESIFICNVVKHRPPANRDPLPAEVSACQPFLQQQVALVRPRVILALGRFAAQTLLGTAAPLGKLREQIHLYHGIPVIATYHPAALLRNEAWKRPAWEDVKVARRILDLSRAADGGGATDA